MIIIYNGGELCKLLPTLFARMEQESFHDHFPKGGTINL